MQKTIHLILLCIFLSIAAFANEEPVRSSRKKPKYIYQPRHDGKCFFMAPKITIAQPTQAAIESAIADAQTQGRIIKINSGGFSIPAALKEITSLPVTFRNQIDGWNYYITVFAMTFTPEGSKLTIGCKFNLPNNQSIYFGANDIAISGKNGFVGELPILETTLSDAKQAEIDDVNGVLAGETKFYELPIPNFNEKLTMGLGKETKIHFECGTFKKFTLSGYLKSFDIVERENNDGTTINDGKPLLLFFGTKDVFDWQDIYFDASVSRSFHHQNLKDIGFNFSASNKAIIDLSKVQNPPNLPNCVIPENWQGVYFPIFQVRIPTFFKLRSGVTLEKRMGKNLLIDKTGLLGNIVAEKVYDLPEGYTDEINKFDMSLDLLSANFVCNQAPDVSMTGRIQLGKCGTVSNGSNKLLYYNFNYDKVHNDYTFLIKDKESGNYSNNKITLETGSTIEFGLNEEALIFNTKLPKTPIITTTAYNNSLCSNFSTNLSIADCTTGMFKWTTVTGDENINPLTITPVTTLADEQIVYRANCYDKYCISEASNSITLTVHNGLPDLSLTSDKSVMCSTEEATLTVGNNCAGQISWITPESSTFTVENISTRKVKYDDFNSTQNKEYKVRCELNGCISNQNIEAKAIIQIKKSISKPILTTYNKDNSENTTHTVCSGNSIIISGSCPDANAVFIWTKGLSSTDANPYTLTTDSNNPRNKEYVYKASCTYDGCASEEELVVKESPIPKPTHFFAVRNPIEMGGLAEIAALGCPQGSDVWSNGKTGIWNGQNGVTMNETLYENKTYTVRCVVNGCSSLPTAPITIYVVPCEEALASPRYIGSDVNAILPNSKVSLSALGCESLSYEWSDGNVMTDNGRSNNFTVYPSETTKYKVRCKKDDNCKSGWTAEYEVRVKTCEEGIYAPSYIGSDLNDVLPNTLVKLYARGCSNQYEWSHGIISTNNDGSSTSITINPSETTNYKVRCKQSDNCKSGWTATYELRVKTCETGIAPPKAIGSVDNINDVSPNTPLKLYAMGCGNMTYEWSNGTISSDEGSNNSSITISPSENTSYKVRCKMDEGCKSGWTGDFEVRVKTLDTTPNWIFQNDICENNQSFKVEKDSNPKSTTYNQIRKIEGGGLDCKCDGKSTEAVWVNQNKDVCIKGYPFMTEMDINNCSPTYNTFRTINKGLKDCSICAGKSTESVWVDQKKDICKNNVSYLTEMDTNKCSPTYGTTRTISQGGSATSPNKPTITLSKSDVNVNESISVSSSCPSGSSLTWTSPIGFNGGPYTATANTTFKAKCVSSENCASEEDSQIVTVSNPCSNPPSAPNVSASPNTINLGETSTLTATGCNGTLIWNNDMTGSSISVSPNVTKLYKVLCTINGCTGPSQSILVFVRCAMPEVSANPKSITTGQSSILTASGCAGKIMWNNDMTGTSITVKPTSTAWYTAKCTGKDCTESAAVGETIEVKKAEPLFSKVYIKVNEYRTYRLFWNNGWYTEDLTLYYDKSTTIKVGTQLYKDSKLTEKPQFNIGTWGSGWTIYFKYNNDRESYSLSEDGYINGTYGPR
ncbi:hypothetical protein [Emticicia sp. SJ17W-69]|uniref:hypothetical protein n=1 Tax=Emticicia sp. SJ17W-69 TaxID=3421657 RepID=UPI003EB81AAE